jgi:5,10-methylenetetrahydrofolate reductase
MASFREALKSNKFLITAEITPPKGVDTSGLRGEAALLPAGIDAVNLSDNQRASMRMTPVAAAKILQEEGFETIVHVTCRDRNRLALQSDLLGAWSLGIRNLLIMTGDHPLLGDTPDAKPVFDLDSTQLLQLIKDLNAGYDLNGDPLRGNTDFLTGAVVRPDPEDSMQLLKLEKKIRCGASFIQTQPVYSASALKEFIEQTEHLNVPIIAGVMPVFSIKTAEFLNEHISGITVPQHIIRRIKNARDPIQEGISITAELITELKDFARGIHIMPVVTHKHTQAILEEAGLERIGGRV